MVTGNLIAAFFAPFEAIGIYSEVIYLILMFVMVGLVYMRTRDAGMVGLFVMMGGASMLPFVRQGFEIYFYGVILLGLSIAAYRLFVKEGS